MADETYLLRNTEIAALDGTAKTHFLNRTPSGSTSRSAI